MVTEAPLSKAPTKKSIPPEGYLCKVCKIPGHWIQQCPQKRKKPQKKSNPNHVHRPGIDPSPEDIERARTLQKLKPPLCFCKISSRLKKVKRSFASSEHQDYPDYEHSRAIGNYFFFCSKKREDPSKCRFARPVQDELAPKAQRVCTFFAKNGSCKKGDLCAFSHEIVGSSISHNNSTKRKRESPHGSSRSNSSNNSNNGEQQTPLKRTKETTTFAPKNNHSSSSSSRNDSASSTSSDRTFETNKLQSQSNPNELMKDDASSSSSSDSDSSSSSSSNNDSDSSDAEDNDTKKVTTGNPVRSSAHDSNDSSSDSDSSSSSSSSDSEGEEEEPKRTTSSQKSSSGTKAESTSDSSSSSESDSD